MTFGVFFTNRIPGGSGSDGAFTVTVFTGSGDTGMTTSVIGCSSTASTSIGESAYSSVRASDSDAAGTSGSRPADAAEVRGATAPPDSTLPPAAVASATCGSASGTSSPVDTRADSPVAAPETVAELDEVAGAGGVGTTGASLDVDAVTSVDVSFPPAVDTRPVEASDVVATTDVTAGGGGGGMAASVIALFRSSASRSSGGHQKQRSTARAALLSPSLSLMRGSASR